MRGSGGGDQVTISEQTRSAVISSIEFTTVSASESFDAGNVVVMAMHLRPAALAEARPGDVSSMAMVRAGCAFRRAAASRYGSGAGLLKGVSPEATIVRKYARRFRRTSVRSISSGRAPDATASGAISAMRRTHSAAPGT